MKQFVPKMFVLLLCGCAGHVVAQDAAPVAGSSPKTGFQTEGLAQAQAEIPVAVSATAQKYVRNITEPNGFGETAKINDAVFFSKDGDVKARQGDILEYAIVVNNKGEGGLADVAVKEVMPPYTDYVAASTRLNGQPVADIDGASPLLAGLPVNDPASPALSGLVRAGSFAVVVFQVKVNLMK